MATPYQSKNLLKKYLDKLNNEELREFKWFLSLNDREGRRPIPMSQLENKSREETVDKLVQVYGAEGAVDVTVDTFIKMKQNDLVMYLSEDRNKEHQMPEPVSSPARENQRHVDSPPPRENQTHVDRPPARENQRHVDRPPARKNHTDEDQTVPQDLSCTICLSVFTEPVTLQCGHSFCKTCVHNHWKVKFPPNCPLCQKVHRNTEPAINFNLNGLSEKFRKSQS